MNQENIKTFELEISLLKKLDHPNIVKYIDTVRTADHLNIVLEFMENGSLAQNLKLFGTLSQSLCAIYVRQILQGLKYLHEQGVIHRDIKGANILTTKQGLVKLADFGVATHTSTESNEVVGTPYWMAPEIIEMSGPTTACDLWSVGCTIVELLTLKPPYFDIPPMAALYRIVQDDHPPLPEDLSPALREFLLQCFKKEPRLRSTADDLLRHRWAHKIRGVQEPKFISENDMEESPQSDKRRTLGRSTLDGADDSSIYSIIGSDSINVSEKQRSVWRKSVMNTIRLSEEQRAAGMKAQKELEAKQKSNVEEDDEDWDSWATDDIQSASAKMSNKDKDGEQAIQQQLRAMIGSKTSPSKKEINLNVGDVDLDDIDVAFGEDSIRIKTSPLMDPSTNLAFRLAKFMEEDSDEVESELVLGDSNEMLHKLEVGHLNEEDDEDPFADDFDDDTDFIEDAGKSIVARHQVQVEKLLNMLRPDRDDQTVLNACSKLKSLFKEQPLQRRTLLTHHGVIPIMEMLEVSSPEVLHSVLQVVLQIIENDKDFQELLSVAGLIPIVAKFCKPTASRPIRLQAAALIQQFLSTSPVTLQMLVACGGVPMLAELFVPCDRHSKNPDISLAVIAVGGMSRVFSLSSTGSGSMPKNDFCRLFAKEQMLRHLLNMMKLCTSAQGKAECQTLQIDCDKLIVDAAELVLIFSHGDHEVKKYFADPVVLGGLLATLNGESLMHQSNSRVKPVVKVLLKIVKNLSMESSVLETLESCGVIPTLLPFLGSTFDQKEDPQFTKEIQNTVMLSMFYLCRISHNRQEQAATCGIIPHLMDAITTMSPVKTFALQILTDLAHTSSLTRDQLWRCGGLEFYLDLLVSGDVFWQEKAFSSLGAWLSSASTEVERAMLQPKSLQRLVSLFQSAQGNNFQNYVTELLAMLTRSTKLAESLGHSGLFLAELVARLSFPKAEVRIKLLKILKVSTLRGCIGFCFTCLDNWRIPSRLGIHGFGP